MTPIQQMLLGVGASKKTYIEDVFSTYLYKGDASTRSINNGLNLSSDGGMTWIKARSSSTYIHHLYDTVRGVGKAIYSSQDYAQSSVASDKLTAFNSNGFSLGASSDVNDSTNTYSSWSFKKTKGFFDIVTYTGDGSSGRNISHNLGCVPGMILVKRTDGTGDWAVYHRGNEVADNNAAQYTLKFNETDARTDDIGYWNDTVPTASVFSVHANSNVNNNGASYVAYLFGGGESLAATARSVYTNGGSSYLSVPTHADYDFGTGDFTIECWIRPNSFGNKNGFIYNF